MVKIKKLTDEMKRYGMKVNDLLVKLPDKFKCLPKDYYSSDFVLKTDKGDLINPVIEAPICVLSDKGITQSKTPIQDILLNAKKLTLITQEGAQLFNIL